MYRLVVNKIRCKFCGDVIESRSRHDFIWCRCGKCATDGGQDYARRAFDGEKPEDVFEDLSIYLDENGNRLTAREVNQKDIPFEKVEGKAEAVPTIKVPEVPAEDKPEAPAVPTLDISEESEAPEAEVVKSEERALQNEDKLKKKAEQVSRIKELRAEGKSFYDISKELDLPESTVRQYYKQN